MINRNEWVDDIQKNISDLIGRSPAADIERNVKAFMAQTFSRLDLVTREEFDIQAQLLEKALHRLTALESRLNQLEGRHPSASVQAEAATQASPTSAAMQGRSSVEPAAPVGPASSAEPVSPADSASSVEPGPSIEMPRSAKPRDLS